MIFSINVPILFTQILVNTDIYMEPISHVQ